MCRTTRISSFIVVLLIGIALHLSQDQLHAQVRIGTWDPHPAAALDMQDTTRGFLPPRLTAAARDAIESPANGLLIYCIDFGELQIYYNFIDKWTNLLGWETVSSPLQIGDSYRGGKIAYLLQPGDPGYDPNVPHGLIAAPSDVSGAASWGCYSSHFPGSSSTAIHTGRKNTEAIINNCSSIGIAAKLCDDLIIGIYDDWYLPSIDELEKLFASKDIVGGYIPESVYWSSSSVSSQKAWSYLFVGPGAPTDMFDKDSPFAVRPVRQF